MPDARPTYLRGEIELAGHSSTDEAGTVRISIVANAATTIEEVAPSGTTFAPLKIDSPRIEIQSDEFAGPTGSLALETFDVARAVWHALGRALEEIEQIGPDPEAEHDRAVDASIAAHEEQLASRDDLP